VADLRPGSITDVATATRLEARETGGTPGSSVSTAERQIRSLVLYVGLAGPRPVWAAQVGRVVDPDGSEGSSRIVRMIKRMIKQGRQVDDMAADLDAAVDPPPPTW
jgi:hypothetical protein